ncbi:MAG: septum site-determining protein MinC [Myxococcota bacterium]
MSQPAEAEAKAATIDLSTVAPNEESSNTLVPDEAVIKAAEAAEAEPVETLVRHEDDVPVLVLPQDVAFDDLRQWADTKAELIKQAFNDRSGRLDLGQRHIELFDLRRLLHHLQGTLEVSISGLYASDSAIQRFAERELKLKLFPTPAEVELEELELDADDIESDPVPLSLDPDGIRQAEVVEASPIEEEEPDVEEPTDTAEDLGRRTLHVNRTVRSGSAVRFDGDVTVFGDVNPGAQVTASGSIIVMGALKGVAHAGATGDEDAFILGLQLQPTQLRIGRRIAIASTTNDRGPEIAVVRDERIVIEAYRTSAMARSNPPTS